MSLYLKLHNRVKQHADADWLTPTQQEKLNQIRKGIELNEMINLYGKHGSGKTFLCWILSKLESAAYVPNPLAFPTPGQTAVIIDNFNYFGKNSFRKISARHSLKKVNRFVIVTVHPFLEEQCFRIKMPIPTFEDIERIIGNLQRIAPLLIIKPPAESFSIWEIFRNLEVSNDGD